MAKQLLIQKTGIDAYTVTIGDRTAQKADFAELKVFTWKELSDYILKDTPFPPRILPTLKNQLESGDLIPLNYPTGEGLANVPA
jgi:hypothetical protein